MLTYYYKLNNILNVIFSRTLRYEFQHDLEDTCREYTSFSKLMLFGVSVIFGINLSISEASDYEWILHIQLGYAFMLSVIIHFRPISLPFWVISLHLPIFILMLIVAEIILYEKYLAYPSFMVPLIFLVSFYFHNLKFSLSLAAVSFGLLAYIFYLRDFEDALILWNLYFGSTILTGIAVYKINSRILKTSQTDALTGLYNRGFAETTLTAQLHLSHRLSTALSLIYIDVDDFKVINDSYGHIRGDKVLCDIANSMQIVSRKSDIASRWGGDEFVIILPATNIVDAQNILERLVKIVINIEISCGLVELQENENIEQFLTRADQSMYEVKNKKNYRIT